MEFLKSNWLLVTILGTIILIYFLSIPLFFWYIYRKSVPSWVKMLKEEKKIFDSILLKKYKRLNSFKKREISDVFDQWQETYSTLLSESDTDTKKRHDDLLQKSGKMYLYKPCLFSSDPPSQENAEMFLKDVFTSAYPSTHDMDDWAMHMRFAELMTLKGISKNDAKKYYVHLKKRFVNHTIVKGIIQMDIYCLK